MADKGNIAARKVTTPKFRVSFPHVFKPHAFNDKQEPKFSVVMLFDKKTDISAMEKAADAAAIDKWGTDKKKWPKGLRMPFRDGNEKGDLKGYKNATVVSASSKEPPGVVDQGRQAILDANAFYAGCYARATLIAFAYDQMGNRGVSFSLQNLQKLGDGEKFSGRKAAEDDFDEVEDDSDSPDSYGSSNDDEDDDGPGF